MKNEKQESEGDDGFTFPLLHNEVSHSVKRENGPVSFTQQQVLSSSPTGNFHGEPAHNNLRFSSLHNPAIPGGFSALSRSQSYDLNHNVQKQVGPSRSYSQLDMNRGFYQAEGSDVKSFSPLNRRQSYDLNRSVQIHDAPSDVNILSHNFDGRFLSLGHNDSAGSAGHYKPETSQGPFYPRVPGLSSGFDVSAASFPSSGQLFNPNQLISAANGRGPLMGNHLTPRYTDTASKGYQIIPSGSNSNGQFRSSESTSTSGIKQQLTTVENNGLYMTSNALSPFQTPSRLGIFSKKNEHDEASQRRIMHTPPSGSFSKTYIAPDNAVSSSIKTEMVNDSNVVGKRSLKRGSSVTIEPPRKLIRHHTINPYPPPQAVTGISQQLIQQAFQSPKTTPHQNNPFSIAPHAKTVAAPQQTSTNATHRPLQISAAGKPLPSRSAAATEHARTVVRRFFERQANALASFKKNTTVPHSSVTTARVPYIRSQEVYKPGERGLKCVVCKRDLGYTAEGPAVLSLCPPDVAVLPCGHVFHDGCLVAVTPPDQRANPPCVPCGMNGRA